ncbi:hypothetical protein [Pluralibacter gergoviae]|uniref:hypothetical protein n=1 Tax=Pluralibacter gergoviae TaxID=61647 RepID=UPI0012D372DC|nr:hypothetical protein [Pluralibacter gergoviae]
MSGEIFLLFPLEVRLLIFLLFAIFTLLYIWNGKDFFKKKDWIVFFIKMVAGYIFSFILVFILVGVSKYLHLMSRENARALVIALPISCFTILFSKFLVVMLNAIFYIVMIFHKRFNSSENYVDLLTVYNRYGHAFHLFVKCLALLGSVFILYGIWLGGAL